MPKLSADFKCIFVYLELENKTQIELECIYEVRMRNLLISKISEDGLIQFKNKELDFRKTLGQAFNLSPVINSRCS